MASDENTVFISVGANLGDKVANCRFGIARLTALAGVSACVTSPFYRTAPVDYLDQDWFVNAAVRLTTTIAPLDLLDHILKNAVLPGRLEDLRFFVGCNDHAAPCRFGVIALPSAPATSDGCRTQWFNHTRP